MPNVHLFWIWNEDITRGADKSLARPTSRCRKTEWIVLNCKYFLVTEAERKHIRRRAVSTTWRRELSSSFFFLQDKAPKEIHAILTETLGEHALSCATVKNWVVQFKRGDFSTFDAPRPGWPKTETTPEIIDQIQELILEDRRISAKSIAE